MSDARPPDPPPPDTTPPEGEPRWVTLDGILEGRVGDGPALARAIAGLNGLGICEFEFDRDGGKFSVLPANRQVRGAGFDAAAQNELLEHLRAIAAAARGPVESTLRCTMVYETQCTETLFRAVAPPPAGDGVETLTRVRPVRADDAPPDLPSQPPWRKMLRRKEVVIVLPLLIVAFGLLAWRSGLVDRLLSANVRGIEIDTHEFGGLLAADVESEWGNYSVTVRRGDDYPSTSAGWDARAAASTTETERLRDNLVREGQDVWVQLRDTEGAVLAQRSVELRPLVTAPDAEVDLALPGMMTAAKVVFSVNKYEKK